MNRRWFLSGLTAKRLAFVVLGSGLAFCLLLSPAATSADTGLGQKKAGTKAQQPPPLAGMPGGTGTNKPLPISKRPAPAGIVERGGLKGGQSQGTTASPLSSPGGTTSGTTSTGPSNVIRPRANINTSTSTTPSNTSSVPTELPNVGAGTFNTFTLVLMMIGLAFVALGSGAKLAGRRI